MAYELDFARIYNKGWGDFSTNLAQIYWEHFKKEGVSVKNILDLACGCGQFLAVLCDKGCNCTGLDISEHMLNVAKENYKDKKIDFVVGDMTNFDFKKQFDLISCNYDAINHLSEFEEWANTFKCAYNNLKSGGYFVFDSNTVNSVNMPDIQQVYLLEGEEYDIVADVSSFNDSKIVMHNVVYEKQENGLYKKIVCTVTETLFEGKQIIKQLKATGFSKITVLDAKYDETKDPDNSRRAYFICKKD